jgi:DHA3 family tetracycline resistance protein-like MFS transporter
MLIPLLRRPYWPAPPTGTYYACVGFSSFLYALTFTLSMVYYVKDVGLSPLQMVLVGTVLEAACFLFEIPTGVVADLYSRRLSVIIGLVIVGLAFLLQGSVQTFEAVLAAQVVWGVGFTFTSGASEAWITDEIGEDHVAHVFSRGLQFHLSATVLGTVAAGTLGLLSLRLPMIISGTGFVLLAIALLLVMREDNFVPTPKGDRETFAHLTSTLVHGLQVARRRPVVRNFFLISIIVGLSSEAFDRLWTVRVLDDFRLPTLFGTSDPAVWFTVFALVGTVISLATSVLVNKVSADRVSALHPNGLLALLTLVQVGGIVGLAVVGNLWLALAAMWARNAALGVLANRTSLGTALVTSAVILSPTALLYLRLRPTRKDTAADAGTSAASGAER